eukprot:g8688.t2
MGRGRAASATEKSPPTPEVSPPVEDQVTAAQRAKQEAHNDRIVATFNSVMLADGLKVLKHHRRSSKKAASRVIRFVPDYGGALVWDKPLRQPGAKASRVPLDAITQVELEGRIVWISAGDERVGFETSKTEDADLMYQAICILVDSHTPAMLAMGNTSLVMRMVRHGSKPSWDLAYLYAMCCTGSKKKEELLRILVASEWALPLLQANADNRRGWHASNGTASTSEKGKTGPTLGDGIDDDDDDNNDDCGCGDDSLLHEALLVDDEGDFLKVVLAQGEEDPDTLSRSGFSPLAMVAYDGSVAKTEALLVARASLQLKNPRNGFIALHVSALEGHVEVTELILASALSNSRERVTSGLPARDIPPRSSVTERRESSLSQSSLHSTGQACPPPAVVDVMDDDGRRPMHIAAINNNVEVMQVLMGAGADVDSRDKCGATPLIYAAKEDNTKAVVALLKADASPDLKDSSGYTALHMAVLRPAGAVVEALIAAGASPGIGGERGHTPLHMACESDARDTVEALLRAGTVPGHCWNDILESPLMVACQHWSMNAVKLLLPHLSVRQVNMRTRVFGDDEGGMTPLVAAMWYDCLDEADTIEIVEALLEVGADPTLTTSSFLHPLAAVVEADNTKASPTLGMPLIRALVSAGADVNGAYSPRGLAPLPIACFEGACGEVVQALLDAGADACMPCAGSTQCAGRPFMTPLQLAGAAGNVEAVSVLIGHRHAGVSTPSVPRLRGQDFQGPGGGGALIEQEVVVVAGRWERRVKVKCFLRFPFRILRGTVELELQSKTGSFGVGQEVFLCPTLCVSDPDEHKYRNNVVKAKNKSYFDRCRTLAFLQEKPTIEIVEDARLKRGVQQVRTADDLFITYPLMRLTFWLHEPASKAVFKVLGPPLLVVTLMWVNFHEFYGLFGDGGFCQKERDSECLANGIGIVITAVFMIPLIRAETRKSRHGSFSHERDQVIEFYTPLTMIVGANGCGKTTIIECLKYACTGALPPGARNGQSFVHDPKVSGTNEVKANIKLRFSARDRTVSVVIRAFQLTQKRKTLQFKALDGVIRTKNDNGQSVSINHKCTEMDKHIPLRLGVSKAILENVVFCHQEDASWPLQEGAVVKKKFDDIFESARYTKALDTIKKTKQEYASTVKDLKVDLAGLQERLRAAKGLQEEVDASTESYNAIRKEIEAIDARNKELSEALEKLHAVADEVGMLEGRKQSLVLACRDLDVRMGEKRENIGDAGLSTESDEALERNLNEFDAKLAACADEINFFKQEAEKCRRRAEAAKKQKDKLQGEQGSIHAQLSQQERVVAARNGMMETLSARHDIFNPAPSASGAGSDTPASSTTYTSGDVSSFEAALQTALDKAQTSLNDVRARNRSEEDTMNAEMNTLKFEQKTSLDAVQAKERELHKIQSESMSLAGGGAFASGALGSQSQLGSVTVSKLKRELEAAEKARAQAIKDSDDFFATDKTSDISKETKALEARLGTIREEVDEAEQAVNALNTQQVEQSEIAFKTTQIEDDKSSLEDRVKNGQAFTSTFVSSPPQDATQAALGAVSTELKLASSKLESDRVEKARQVMDLHREVAQNNTNLVNTKRDKSRVLNKLEELKSAVEVVKECTKGVADPDSGESLDPEKHLDWILKQWREKEDALKKKQFTAKWIKKFINLAVKRAEDEHICMTCSRPLNEQEREVLKETQQQSLQDNNEEATARVQQDLASCATTIKRLTDVAGTWRERLRLSSRPEELAEEQARLEAEATEKKMELEREQKEERELLAARQKVDEDLREVERCLEEAIRIDNVRIEVEAIKAKLQRYNQDRGTLAEARERLRKLTAEKDKVINDIQAKTKEVTVLGNRKYEVTTNRNMREADYDKALESLEAKKEFDKKRETLRERERTLEGELKELKAKEQPLRQQLDEMTRKNTRARDKARAEVDRAHTAFQECQADLKAFSRSQKEVMAGIAKNLPDSLKSVKAKLQEAEATVEENERAARENEQTMSGRVLQSDKQVHLKKLLRNNIDYRALKRELKERQKDVTEVEKEISETNSEEKISDISKEQSRKTQKRAELKGRLHGMKDQIRSLETKLMTDTYKNIEEKHRRKMIEHRTTEMAVTDLDKSYNYRVVMRKNDATLDMKGRCSAGQRVLASVVIRLALAETFCVSCGILALDEPTTNLDHHNKVGLAHALAKIISSRSKQSNFQLITITHDEEFVQTMRTELGTQGGFSMPEFYWRISREEMSRGKFYSRIDRLDWEDM